jgi:hypothetical protein
LTLISFFTPAKYANIQYINIKHILFFYLFQEVNVLDSFFYQPLAVEKPSTDGQALCLPK